MKRCPRCDAAVETLHAVPDGELREGIATGGGSTTTGSEVCSICLHEIREG